MKVYIQEESLLLVSTGATAFSDHHTAVSLEPDGSLISWEEVELDEHMMSSSTLLPISGEDLIEIIQELGSRYGSST